MADLGAKAQSTLGMTPGTRFYSPAPFSGMNTQDTPVTIDDREFVLNENFFHLGNGKLRTAWDVGPAVYTATGGRRIISFFAYTIAGVYYQAVFLSDGSAVQFNTTSGATTQIGPAGTFWLAGGGLPAATQWGTIYLIIANRNTPNDYWLWDGVTLYAAGTVAPNGVNILATGNNYTSLPTVTPFGGLGSGLVAVPFVNAGGVVNFKITNPGVGYQVGDVVQLAFSGGGSDTSAQIVANLVNGGVGAANVTVPGSGYTSPPAVGFSGGGGSGAAGTAQIGSGVSSIAVTAGGTLYSTPPLVTFTGGGGSGASATATIVGGIVTAVSIDNPGSGYTSAPTVGLSGGGGSGATATASIQNGIVTGITITAPGSGYTTAPTIALTGGGGSSAAAVALLNPAGVQSVTVVNGGSGFLYAPNISFVGGGGSGASGIVQLTGTSIARINVLAGGQGYATAPKIIFSGGGAGSGAAATAVIANGQVVAINLTNAGSGYTTNLEVQIQPANFGKANQDLGTGAGAIAIFVPTTIAGVLISDAGLHYTSAPAVVIASGANNAAYATVSLMPFGVSGSTVETYSSRVWIANPDAQPYATIPPGGTFQVGAPNSLTDFATSDGGVIFTSSDGFLQTRYVHFQQANGYLYAFGDGSISIISSVATAGTPTTTAFNYQTIDPDIGVTWRDSLTSFSRTLLFANETGVFGLYGGAATKVSDKMNDVFDTAILPPDPRAVTPSGGTATINTIRHYFLLMTIVDQTTGLPATKMVCWNEKEWFLASQTVNLIFIGTQKVRSQQTLWGTDGKSLYRLFHQPSSKLKKTLWTKYYGGAQSMFLIKNAGNVYVQAQDQSVAQTGVDFTVQFVFSGLAVQSLDPAEASVVSGIVSDFLYVSPNFPAPPPFWPVFGAGSGGAPFMTMGVELTTTSPDFVLSNLLLSYQDIRADS